MSVRAGIVVTGTEVLSGKVSDRNGPWLADRLFELGIDLAHITIVGDRPEDMEAQLRFMADQGVELIVTTGGLGPTADDLTGEVVARFQERPLELSAEMEAKIAEILKPLMRRFDHLDPDAVMAANRKQALVPDGATTIDPAGTAPGLVVPPPDGRGGPTVVVMPGPPRELHSMWPLAVETAAFQDAVAGRTVYEERMLRLFGIPESEIAETLRVAEDAVESFAKVEITTCLRRGEVEVTARYEPDGAEAWAAIEELIAERHPRALFSRDGKRIDDQVAELLTGRWVAAAESCTGGLLLARLTERPGASAYVAGGVVSLLEPGEERPAGRGPRADRDPRRGFARGGGGDGRRRPRALRRRRGGVDHRGRGSGRRHRGEAGRLRLLVREVVERGQAGPRRAHSRGPRRDPRSLHHGGHAPPAPGPDG